MVAQDPQDLEGVFLDEALFCAEEAVERLEAKHEAESKLLRGEREEPEELLCEPRTFRWQEKAFSREEVKDIRADLEPGGRKGLIGGAVNIATGVTRGAVNVATGVTKAATLGIVDLGGMSAGTVTNYQRAELERLPQFGKELTG